MELNIIHNEDCLETMSKMKNDSIDLIVTSPPYNKSGLGGSTKVGNQIWQKFNIDYDTYNDNVPEQDYQEWMISIIDEMLRVIKPTGSIFFNHKPRRSKNVCHLPTDFIGKTKANIYQLIIWDRKNSPNIRNDILVPSTEHIYWLTKGKPKTFRKNIDPKFISEVWTIPPSKQKMHPAPFPEELVSNCIKLTTEENDVVYDPFMGSGTSAIVALENNRNFIGSELSLEYCSIANERLEKSER